ncbi:MAG: hypothetical protein IIA67_07545 [Planctomycetes bacterium]|nr:hypothetical protein [Planctomycetota bacterium]
MNDSQPLDAMPATADVSPGIALNWQPPQLWGEPLRKWASGKAHVAAITSLALAEPTPRLPILLAEEIAQGASYAMDRSPQKDCRECAAGCPGCCRVMVAVTVPEVLSAADYLRRNCQANLVGKIQQQATKTAAQTVDMNKNQYAEQQLPCAMLSADDCCMTYPARPIRCRGWCSLSVDRCNECFLTKAMDQTVPIDAHAYAVGQGAADGLSAGITSAGLDGTFYELNSALARALDVPDAAEQWLRGEPVFSDCNRYE